MSSPGFEYTCAGTACFSNAYLILHYVFTKEVSTGREIAFRSLDVTDKPCLGHS